MGDDIFLSPIFVKRSVLLKKDANVNLLDNALEVIDVLRRDGARIHSITNTVAQNFTANVLLACNTKPSMTVNPDEVDAFTSRADALHINLGTLDKGRISAINKALIVANTRCIPVLLDPVMAHVSPLRAEFAGEVMDRGTIIRGNVHEIKTLGIQEDGNSCIVMTGEEDQVMYRGHSYTVNNGNPVMAKVIATGCALGGLITALSSKTENPSCASIAGLIWFGIAGEIATTKSQSPGSFVPYFIDALYETPIDTLREQARLS